MNNELNALKEENEKLQKQIDKLKKESELRKKLFSALLHKYDRLKKERNTIRSCL